MGPLASAFRAHHPNASVPDLEGLLRGIVARCAGAWPGVGAPDRGFVEHVARRLDPGADVGQALEALCLPDLFLAYACAIGDPVAMATFEREVLVRVRPYLLRIDSGGLADEVVQLLRQKLLVPAPGATPAIADYEGRAPLAAWVRTAAVRTARSLLRRDSRNVRLDTQRAAGVPSAGADPEMLLIKERHGAELNRALESALEKLPVKDRALLRLYFVERLSLQAIGRVYHTHESTISRRIAATREQLVAAVRAELQVSPRELDSLLAVMRSRLAVDLARHLAKAGRSSG